ncbi:nuclear transport factor 2 family protein [Actinomadura rifamycini]|uniref:nuclear transport factor 2 family protein n=1 Tax=Actinomadura rifamycini TaxID=31962 RepID=UPI000A041C41|nr:nuclear transport factor 2 family protein [Actinomadura rifamycini]
MSTGSTSTGSTSTGSTARGGVEDHVEIQQLLARYAVTITRGDIDGLLGVFTPDGTYSAFGDTYRLDEFPELVEAAPKGLFLTGTAAVEIDGDTATGTQPLCFVDHSTHEMRIGYYNDTYARTGDGWRLRTRAMTFIRRSGAHDSGRPHAHRRAGA